MDNGCCELLFFIFYYKYRHCLKTNGQKLESLELCSFVANRFMKGSDDVVDNNDDRLKGCLLV